MDKLEQKSVTSENEYDIVSDSDPILEKTDNHEDLLEGSGDDVGEEEKTPEEEKTSEEKPPKEEENHQLKIKKLVDFYISQNANILIGSYPVFGKTMDKFYFYLISKFILKTTIFPFKNEVLIELLKNAGEKQPVSLQEVLDMFLATNNVICYGNRNLRHSADLKLLTDVISQLVILCQNSIAADLSALSRYNLVASNNFPLWTSLALLESFDRIFKMCDPDLKELVDQYQIDFIGSQLQNLFWDDKCSDQYRYHMHRALERHATNLHLGQNFLRFVCFPYGWKSSSLDFNRYKSLAESTFFAIEDMFSTFITNWDSAKETQIGTQTYRCRHTINDIIKFYHAMSPEQRASNRNKLHECLLKSRPLLVSSITASSGAIVTLMADIHFSHFRSSDTLDTDEKANRELICDLYQRLIDQASGTTDRDTSEAEFLSPELEDSDEIPSILSLWFPSTDPDIIRAAFQGGIVGSFTAMLLLNVFKSN